MLWFVNTLAQVILAPQLLTLFKTAAGKGYCKTGRPGVCDKHQRSGLLRLQCVLYNNTFFYQNTFENTTTNWPQGAYDRQAHWSGTAAL